jgi:uncharacterized protein YjiS (DUF1127 family)
MTAQFAKDQVAFFAPATISARTPAQGFAPRTTGLVGRVRAAVAWINERMERRAVLDDLSALSDRELADIGLARSDIPSVFDPGFAARRGLPQPLQV